MQKDDKLLSTVIKHSLFGLFCLLFLLPKAIFAWNATNHKLIAQIAYNNLTPTARHQVKHLLAVLDRQYPGTRYMTNAAVLLDRLKLSGIKDYNTWHYYDLPYQPNGKFVSQTPKGKAVQAIQRARLQLSNKSKHSNEQQRAFYLSVLLHVVGDIHQPLHGTSLYSKRFPRGDAGGHGYKIRYPYAKDLHKLWDAGLYFYMEPGQKGRRKPNRSLRYQQIRRLALKLQRKYPLQAWQAQLKVVNPRDWAIESFRIATAQAYNTPYGKRPSQRYFKQGQTTAQRRIVLAGYRLAKALNTIFR